MAQRDKTIKCFAFYDTLDSTDDRMNNPAAYTKSSYIFECFQALGYKVDILSASGVVGKKGAKGRKRTIGDGITLRTLTSFGRGSRLKNAITRIPFMINMVFKLLFFVKKDDMLWVYHSLPLIKYIKLLKKIRKFRLLLEVEEIYGKVIGSEKAVKREMEFFTYADGYIFCTDLLENAVNTSSKPYAIVHGTYKTEKACKNTSDDGKIHCVYAGTLDPRKGALNAVNAARFLDDNYHVHILGYGIDEEVALIKEEVRKASDCGGAKVTYDGILSGKEYTDFLSRCTIGLCTQEPEASFNNTSFPSKVLVYMSNGLRVVSVSIPAIENSDVGEYLYFYRKSSPEAVAEAVRSVNLGGDYDGKAIIEKLDKKFIGELDELLKEI